MSGAAFDRLATIIFAPFIILFLIIGVSCLIQTALMMLLMIWR